MEQKIQKMCPFTLDPAFFIPFFGVWAAFLYSNYKSRQRQQTLYDDYTSKIAKYHIDDAHEDKDKV
jgi:hypothetical protein